MRTTNRPSASCVYCLLIPLVCVFARPAQGELVIEVGHRGAIGISSIEMIAGESLVLDLYITQIDGTDRLSQVGTSINTAEIELNLSGGPGLTFSGRTFGDFFADEGGLTQLSGDRLLFSVRSAKPSDASLGGEIPGVLASEDGVDDNSLRLGDFTLRSDPNVAGMFMVDLVGPFVGPFSGTTTPDTAFTGVPLRSGSLSVQVTAVPETSGFVAILAIALSVGMRVRRAASISTPDRFRLGG